MSAINTNRRNFLKGARFAGATGVLALFSIAGLPSLAMANDPIDCPTPQASVLTPTIAKNHGHAFTISLAELKAKGPGEYSIQGTSGHPHTVVISTEALLALLIHNVVEMETTKDAGHTHIVKLEIGLPT